MSSPSHPPNLANCEGVMVLSGGSYANTLGVIRAFGTRNIHVVYLDSDRHSIVRYSRYIKTSLKIDESNGWERNCIRVLLEFGRKCKGKMVIVPTSDKNLLILAKHKRELEQFYVIPLSSYENIERLVNKKKFYKWLARKNVPHPKTHFPENTDELKYIGSNVQFPFIIKPVYSHVFQEEFGRKCLIINSVRDLSYAVKSLRDADEPEVMIQEIIPGKELYDFYAYFDNKSRLLAVCGYDKMRQWPTDFGFGSLCISKWRPSVARQYIELLQTIGYTGFAEVELKKDPRDGHYKLLEMNARTTLQNRLAASCGTDIEYVSYLDSIGACEAQVVYGRQGVSWVDDFSDTSALLVLARQGQARISDLFLSLKPGTVHSVASLKDPVPFVTRLFQSVSRRVRHI